MTDYVLFAGGVDTNTPPTYSVNYEFFDIVGGTVLGGTYVIASLGRGYSAAAGTSVSALIQGGDSYGTSGITRWGDLYIWASGATYPSTTLGVAVRGLSAAGNATVGVFSGGYTGSAYNGETDEINYAANTATLGTSLTAMAYQAAAGTSTAAVFAAGTNGVLTSATTSYTYATHVAAAGTALGLARSNLGASSDLTVGVYAGGTTGTQSTYVDLYAYSGATVTAGAVLATATSNVAAGGNPDRAVFSGLTSGGVNYTTEIYGFVAATWTAGANFGLAYSARAATDNTLFTGPSFTTVIQNGSTVGNSYAGVALFAGGYWFYSGDVATTTLYYYHDDACVPGVALGYVVETAGAASNPTYAYIAGGWSGGRIATSQKYTFGINVVAAGGSLSAAKSYVSGTGNATVGVFGGGMNAAGTRLATTDVYTYSGDTVSPGTALGVARTAPGATSISTVGYFAGGYTGTSSTSYVDKYTYSGNTVAVGTALDTTRDSLAAAGGPTSGIFAGGYDVGGSGGNSSATTSKYTYSGDTTTAGTSLNAATDSLVGAANSQQAVFTGGGYYIGATSPYPNYSLSLSTKYYFATDSVLPGTTIPTPLSLSAGASSVLSYIPPPPTTTTWGVSGGITLGGRGNLLALPQRMVILPTMGVVFGGHATFYSPLNSVWVPKGGVILGGIGMWAPTVTVFAPSGGVHFGGHGLFGGTVSTVIPRVTVILPSGGITLGGAG